MSPRPERPEPAPVLYEPAPEAEPSGPARVATSGPNFLGPRDAALRALRQDGVAAKLAAKDPTLWGPDAEPEAAVRLGWLDLPQSSRELVPRIAALRDELRAEGVDRVVLCGMGGSSLAPEVICAASGVPLVVLDSTDPGQVRAALADLDRTVVVVASKSGSTLETDSHRRLFAEHVPPSRMVAVTDPGSALAEAATGWRATFLADPDVGGRYSALSAFGLVPSGLAGAEIGTLLDDAAAVLPDLASGTGNPGLLLGAALGGCARAGRDKLVMEDSPFAAWVEQLVAESTGKQGRGILPVLVEDVPAAKTTDDLHPVGRRPGTEFEGPLGAAFLVWEYATAVAGRVLGVNPFDQPDVEAAKVGARALLDGGFDGGDEKPVFTAGPVEAYGDTSADSLDALYDELLEAIPPSGYLAIHAYLDRHRDAAAAGLRAKLAERTHRPVTFGWGPRFLHSTGQFHKGGPATGVFLQVTGAVRDDLAIPGREFTFGQLQLAQALGDAKVLRERGRPVVRLHLLDRTAPLV